MLKFSPTGKTFTGPPVTVAHELTGTVGQPVTLEVFTTDDMHEEEGQNPATASRVPKLAQSWHKHRGPGAVTFAEQRPKIGEGGKSTTSATFAALGEYMLRAQANDNSGEGGGGFQCCWTNAYVKVHVQ